jgi:hypothetical protein
MVHKRSKILIDPKVQGTLVMRLVAYWLLCLAGIFALLAGIPIVICALGLPNQPTIGELLYMTWLNFWPALFASLILLPFVVGDCLRVSNKFVGPVFRIRRAMKQLANGEKVEAVKFRDNDFWYDFAEDFNRVLKRMEEERGNGPSPTAEENVSA